MNPSILRATRLLTLALLGLVWASPAFGFRMIQATTAGRVTAGSLVPCNSPGGFLHWAPGNHNVPWRHNTANQGAGKAAALQAALAAWNAVPGDDYNLSYAGTTGAGFSTDGTNAAVWAVGNGCTGNCLALTALVVQLPGQIVIETDVTFNNSVTWTTNGTQFDTQAVATHEFGHTLGVHHTELSSSPLPTMYPSYFGPDGRTLEADDRAALLCSYNRYQGPGTEYHAHVEAIGWQPYVQDGHTAGTTGQHKRMEAVQIFLFSAGGMGVCYRSHVEAIGWMGTVCNGAISGTVGQHKRMEAIEISLTGAPAGCNVQYRAYIQGSGWQGWVQNGATAGTVGQHLRMEALEVKLSGC